MPVTTPTQLYHLTNPVQKSFMTSHNPSPSHSQATWISFQQPLVTQHDATDPPGASGAVREPHGADELQIVAVHSEAGGGAHCPATLKLLLRWGANCCPAPLWRNDTQQQHGQTTTEHPPPQQSVDVRPIFFSVLFCFLSTKNDEFSVEPLNFFVLVALSVLVV